MMQDRRSKVCQRYVKDILPGPLVLILTLGLWLLARLTQLILVMKNGLWVDGLL